MFSDLVICNDELAKWMERRGKTIRESEKVGSGGSEICFEKRVERYTW